LNYQKQEIKDEYIEDFKILSKEEYEIILTSYFLDKISIKRKFVRRPPRIRVIIINKIM